VQRRNRSGSAPRSPDDTAPRSAGRYRVDPGSAARVAVGGLAAYTFANLERAAALTARSLFPSRRRAAGDRLGDNAIVGSRRDRRRSGRSLPPRTSRPSRRRRTIAFDGIQSPGQLEAGDRIGDVALVPIGPDRRFGGHADSTARSALAARGRDCSSSSKAVATRWAALRVESTRKGNRRMPRGRAGRGLVRRRSGQLGVQASPFPRPPSPRRPSWH
jgi:hypothetical protein